MVDRNPRRARIGEPRDRGDASVVQRQHLDGERPVRPADYSPETRCYAFAHVQVPLPVRTSQGRFAVEARPDGGSEVVLESEFDAADREQEPQIAAMIEGAYGQALESLRRRIERGLRWDQP